MDIILFRFDIIWFYGVELGLRFRREVKLMVDFENYRGVVSSFFGVFEVVVFRFGFYFFGGIGGRKSREGKRWKGVGELVFLMYKYFISR